MGKREIKKLAYMKASIVLQGCMDAGWESPKVNGQVLSETDEKKLWAAMEEIVEELEQKAHCRLRARPDLGEGVRP